MYLTDAVISVALANRMQRDAATLPPQWTEIVTSSHAAAYNDIVRALVARGFTLAQIVQWDAGADFERDIALYYCLKAGGVLAAFNGGELNRKGELAGVQVFIAGVYVNPAQPSPGQVMSGKIGRGEHFGPPGAFQSDRDLGGWDRE